MTCSREAQEPGTEDVLHQPRVLLLQPQTRWAISRCAPLFLCGQIYKSRVKKAFDSFKQKGCDQDCETSEKIKGLKMVPRRNRNYLGGK